MNRRKITFLNIQTFPSNYLLPYYIKLLLNPMMDYDTALRIVSMKAPWWRSHLSKYLNDEKFDAIDLIINYDLLQQRWAKEVGLNKITSNLVFIKQLDNLKPDVVYFDSLSIPYLFKNDAVFEMLRKTLKVIWFCAPFDQKAKEVLTRFDLVVTGSIGFKQEFDEMGIRSVVIPHAFESSVLRQVKGVKQKRQLCFVGGISHTDAGHLDRLNLIQSLVSKKLPVSFHTDLKNVGYDYYLNLTLYNMIRYLKKFIDVSRIPLLGKIGNWEKPEKQRIPENVKNVMNGPLYGVDLIREYASSSIVFNNHSAAAGDYALNVRMFEATGAGSCLLTDYKRNITDFFEPDKEIITYSTNDELIDKAEKLLLDPNYAKRIALSGQKRTLSDHTVEKRVELLKRSIEGMIE